MNTLKIVIRKNIFIEKKHPDTFFASFALFFAIFGVSGHFVLFLRNGTQKTNKNIRKYDTRHFSQHGIPAILGSYRVFSIIFCQTSSHGTQSYSL